MSAESGAPSGALSKPPGIWPAMFSFLMAAWPAIEVRQSEEALTSLRQMLADLDERAQGGENLNFAALDLARSYASNTLTRTATEIAHWQTAQRLCAQDLSQNRPLTLEMITSWNQQIRQDFDQAPLRQIDLYLTGQKLLPGDEVAAALEDFKDKVLAVDEDPFVRASRIYQWLISIHPFINANGRTARLAADYVLIQNGYLPLVFPTPLSGAVALFAHSFQVRPYFAFQKVIIGVERSAEILLLKPLDP